MDKVTVFIKTYGCALNKSDSELMAGLLEKSDFEIVDKSKKADVIIINTCTVKTPTENRFYRYLEKVKKQKKPIIIAGCIAQSKPKELKEYTLIGTSQITNIVPVVEEAYHNNVVHLLEKEQFQRLNLPKKRKNPVIEIIPICEGCLGDPCAYCKVKEVRGDLRSYAEEDIFEQVSKAVRSGIPEIWLTAQDTGCYGKDIETNVSEPPGEGINSSLPQLLNRIIKIPGTFKIRLGMLNPNHVLECLDELIEVYRSEKIFKFLHIPLQSGNNEILKSMKRKYTIEEFKQIINKFRAEIPNITIATDIIVGFPGETEEQFDDSLNLIKEIKPDIINISRFWPRPKTKAAKMENQIKGEEIKRRSRIITDIFHNIARMQNEKWYGWEGEILIDEKGKEDTMVGRNFAYKPVIVKQGKLGDIMNVKIRAITSFDLRGY